MLFKYRIVILSLSILLMGNPIHGSDYESFDSAGISGVFQTAGYAGLASFGLGFDYSRFSSDILLGYVPESVGGEELWSLTCKLNLTLFDIKNRDTQYGIYIGVILLYSFKT
jgi:hypothetical protein